MLRGLKEVGVGAGDGGGWSWEAGTEQFAGKGFGFLILSRTAMLVTWAF